MENTFGNMCLWIVRYGFDINPTSMELMLFTTKTRVLAIHDATK